MPLPLLTVSLQSTFSIKCMSTLMFLKKDFNRLR